MSEALRFAEVDEQYIELLPTRMVLSLFSLNPAGGDPSGGSTVTSSCTGGFGQNQGVGFQGPDGTGINLSSKACTPPAVGTGQ